MPGVFFSTPAGAGLGRNFKALELSGAELWHSTDQLMLDDVNVSSSSTGPSTGSKPEPCCFFSIAEKPMTSLTLLGETSMRNVDFFVTTYDCVSEQSAVDGSSRTVSIVPRALVDVAP